MGLIHEDVCGKCSRDDVPPLTAQCDVCGIYLCCCCELEGCCDQIMYDANNDPRVEAEMSEERDEWLAQEAEQTEVGT